MRALRKRSFVLILASWQMDAPTGMERATAALAVGLAAVGHRATIVTGAHQPSSSGLPGVAVEQLSLPVAFPCDEDSLRKAMAANEAALQTQLLTVVDRHQADAVVFMDALWGLGRLSVSLPEGVRRVLAVHTLPSGEDLAQVLPHTHEVVIPSLVVRLEAAMAGWDPSAWKVVPNALLHDHRSHDYEKRMARRSAPVRMLAGLGPDQGIAPLLTAAATWHRRLEVTLALSGNRETDCDQGELLDSCRQIVDSAANISLLPQLSWRDIPAWLAEASSVIVPSMRGAFGLVALEAMSVGTPVIASRVGNLPALLEPAIRGRELLAEPVHGPHELLDLVDKLLDDPVAYGATSEAVYTRSLKYKPGPIARQFVDAVT
ncbi:glycosyltransferase [Streptomyces sp. NPDC004647]|uniref:glycosyltransferase n=1 Tax=Streptomyces sp. NPDC004647 TaxID=3154671 RepID=UPI0033AA0F3F